jgi:hypothetical protein
MNPSGYLTNSPTNSSLTGWTHSLLTVLLITFRHGPHRKHRYSVEVYGSSPNCLLRGRCLTTGLHATIFSTPLTPLLLHSILLSFLLIHSVICFTRSPCGYQISRLFSSSPAVYAICPHHCGLLFSIPSFTVFTISSTLSTSFPIIYSSACSPICTLSFNSPVRKCIHIMDVVRKDINVLKRICNIHTTDRKTNFVISGEN